MLQLRGGRDPFARTTLFRETIDAGGCTCSWCGLTRKNGKLYVYITVYDGGNKRTHNGSFCSKSCHDSYHS